MNMFVKILFLKNASYSEKGSTFNIHMRLQHSSQSLLFIAFHAFSLLITQHIVGTQ